MVFEAEGMEPGCDGGAEAENAEVGGGRRHGFL